MKSCQQCGGTAIEREEHHFEALNVCLSCGSSVVDVERLFTSQGSFSSSKSRKPSRFPTVTASGTTLPMQLQGHVEKKPTGARKSCEKEVKLAVDKLKLSRSVSSEALYLLSTVCLNGRGFKMDCLAAACVFVALRTHQKDINLSKVARLLKVDLKESNRVVKYLAKNETLQIKAREFTEANDFVRQQFIRCQFWKSDGSEMDNGRMLQRVTDLVMLLGRIPVSNVYLSEGFVVAAAFLIYKSEDLQIRGKLAIAQFVNECSFSIAPDELQLVTRNSKVIVRCLKKLVEELPYVQKSLVKHLKCNDVLKYMEDVEKHAEILVAGTQSGMYPKLEVAFSVKKEISFNDEGSSSFADVCDETLDEEELNSYIRTESEVKMLKPIFEKVYKV